MINYDPHTWRTTLFAVRGSMVKVIGFRSLLVSVVATALTAVHQELFQIAPGNVGMVHALIGPALSLLLVFRTNASYDRFWEGRKLWGAMVNTCRNVARAASVQLASRPHELNRVLRLTAAFPEATTAVLRGQQWRPELLAPDDAAEIATRVHPPTAIAQRITHHLNEARRAGAVDSIVFGALDQNCQALVDIVGACERIHKTPLPFAYAVHLRRALILYCVTLPFALLPVFGWFTIAVTFALTYVLLGVEEIGVEIEDPFDGDANDLPLEDIDAVIRKNVETYLPATSTVSRAQ